MYVKYTSPDGATVVLPSEDGMRLYAAMGFKGTLVAAAGPAPVAPVVPEPVVPVVSVEEEEDEDDEGEGEDEGEDDDHEDDDHEGAKPWKAAIASATAPVVATVAGPRTVEQAASEQRVQAEIVRRVVGAALPPTRFALGTEMIPAGKAQYRALVQEVEALPSWEDAASAMASRIAAEKRRNVVAHPRDMRIEWDGESLLLAAGTETVAVEEEGLAKLAYRYPRYLVTGSEHAKMAPDTLADALTHGLRQIPLDSPASTIRVRVLNGGLPQAFAVCGPTFPDNADADRVLYASLTALRGQGMRGEITYVPEDTTVRAKAIWTAPQAMDAHVGDVFQVYWQSKTRDNGTMAFRGGGGALRVLCVNCTVGSVDADDVIRKIHRGDVVDFASAIAASAAQARDGFAPFAQAWGVLRQTAVASVELWGKSFASVPDALAWAVEAGKITAGVKRDALAQSLLQGYAMEPGDTLADMINAITRAAQAWPLDTRDALETLAGRELVPVLAGYATATA